MIRQVAERPASRLAQDDHYHVLFSRLKAMSWGERGQLQTVGITSTVSGEGVSTIAACLAAAAADHDEEPVLLIDSNISRPWAAKAFGLANAPGLAEAVLQGADLQQCMHGGTSQNLVVLPAGGRPDSAAQVFESPKLKTVMEELKRQFSTIVVDMPPVGRGGSGLRLAPLLDGVVLVVEAEGVRWEVAGRTRDLLAEVRANVLGAVFNRRRDHIPDWLYRVL